jgi:hypothetical protein
MVVAGGPIIGHGAAAELGMRANDRYRELSTAAASSPSFEGRPAVL